MAKQKTTKWTKVISYILIVLVVISICGLVAYFTNGFTSDFKTFYVENNGNKILETSNGYTISNTKPLTFDVKYTFGNANKEVSGYSVKVVPNIIAGKDFDFTLDGSTYSFQAETDLTAGFDIESKEKSFTIKPKGGITKILQSVYPNYAVGDYSDKGYTDMFTLVITSYNGKASIKVDFSVVEKIAGVTIDKEEIIF